eukprot:TRINITY_DN186_c0_g3_i1.p1 TRINITY_DN186_c0_g3~~TRINITY_DN186_c0_g3_i1.p1  ORF type:complete len:369 (-),score=82.84 TRINITY_DN186_c0_g3_i1:103-1209(-)
MADTTTTTTATPLPLSTEAEVGAAGDADEALPPVHPAISAPESLSLPDNVVFLRSPSGAVCYIIGTAHVSLKSAEDAAALVLMTEPDQLVLELDRSRVGILSMVDTPPAETPTASPSDDIGVAGPDSTLAPDEQVTVKGKEKETGSEVEEEKKDVDKDGKEEAKKSIFTLELLKRARAVGIMGALLETLYSTLSTKLNVKPGAEFRSAFRTLKSLQKGFTVVLGDRPVSVTLKRVWGALTMYEKCKFVWQMLNGLRQDIDSDLIESMLGEDIVAQMIELMKDEFPSILTPLIFERDAFLAAKIRSQPGPVVVAVVGLGHLAGIQSSWEKEINLNELSAIPPPHPLWRPKLYASVSVAVVAWWVSSWIW